MSGEVQRRYLGHEVSLHIWRG